MNSEFIPYEQALALKELGFDEPCLMYYDYSWRLVESGVYKYKAPLYQQAFRWFREKHNVFSSVNVNYCYKIYNNDELFEESNEHNNYEEAELACLKKLIEIVKVK